MNTEGVGTPEPSRSSHPLRSMNTFRCMTNSITILAMLHINRQSFLDGSDIPILLWTTSIIPERQICGCVWQRRRAGWAPHAEPCNVRTSTALQSFLSSIPRIARCGSHLNNGSGMTELLAIREGESDVSGNFAQMCAPELQLLD
jgi:hypothetical protein